MKWWKVLGVAGFVGVAATGVVIARSERRRRAYTPDEVRERLRQRATEASRAPEPVEPMTARLTPGERSSPRARWSRRLSRLRPRRGPRR
jgi:hypothetical protein